MALSAELSIENHQYLVKELEYEITQPVDITGLPSDRPRGGLIHFSIQTPEDSDLLFHEWMIDKEHVKDGSFTIQVNHEEQFLPKTITFRDAYCVRLYEHFSNSDNMPMITKLSIMAGTLIFGDNCEFKMID